MGLHLGDPNGGGPGRKAVISQLENSLRRLRTDDVDLYWLHNFDPVTPVEETPSPAAVALAWVQARPGITSTLIGARRMDQFETNLAALDLTLGAEHQARLTEVSAPRLNFPAENNATLARLARNGGTTVDGLPTAAPPRLVTGARVLTRSRMTGACTTVRSGKYF